MKKIMHCPNCGKEMTFDSERKHVNGQVRLYWECKDCNLSVMWREAKKEETK